jgi:hypothetical protein
MRIALLVALSLVAVVPAFATDGPGGPGDNTGRAELITDPMVPTEGPGNPGHGTGQPLIIDLHRMFAGDGPPTGPGDGTSRAELTTDRPVMVAGGRGGIGGEV